MASIYHDATFCVYVTRVRDNVVQVVVVVVVAFVIAM